MSLDTIVDFLLPVQIAAITEDEGLADVQLGKHIQVYETELPDLASADLIIVGCSDMRGSHPAVKETNAPNVIRKAFYSLFRWHNDVQIADIGNIISGASLQDTYAALRMVLSELQSLQKKVVILGGSHDLTMAQYQALGAAGKIVEGTCVDARIDMNLESPMPADQFLVEMFTGIPNYLRHYNHIGFQSYFMHPQMLETIDKLRFDCYRVGRVKEHIEEMEPAIRNAHFFSFDIAAIQHAHAPANKLTPNGFNGEEACTLMQYAGMSSNVSTVGIYGYYDADDIHELTAKQIAHMLWYLVDGIQKGKFEADMTDRDAFYEFTLAFAEAETVFLQSKKTGRWWVQIPDGKFIACTKNDYLTASANDIPERWLRAIERM